jgi:hypothetical protein
MIRNFSTLQTYKDKFCPQDKSHCLGPACMAWVWESDSATERAEVKAPGMHEQFKKDAKYFDENLRRGWCGLVA